MEKNTAEQTAISGKRRFLLISYVFPTYYGIGGKRWAMLCDCLATKGHTIDVVTAKNPFDRDSLWSKNVINRPDINIHQLDPQFPKVLLTIPMDFLSRTRYRIQLLKMKLITRGTPFDRSVIWSASMKQKILQLIKQNKYDAIIASGPPFYSVHTASRIALEHQIPLIVDLRDPWTWGPNWGYPSLKGKRSGFESVMEMESLAAASLITVPGETMRKHILEKYPHMSKKVEVIPHFFDQRDFGNLDKKPGKKLRLMLYGSIYQDIAHYMKKVAVFCAQNQDRIQLDIFTDVQNHSDLFKEAGAKNVVYHNPIPPPELFMHFAHTDFALMINPEYNINNISTKFFEIIYSRTPILLVSSKGLASDFITSNKLGIWTTLDHLDSTLNNLVQNKDPLDYNAAFDITDYSLEAVCTQLLSRISEKLDKPRNEITHPGRYKA